MIRAEWRKAWSQPATLALLFLVCAAQVIFVLCTMNPEAKQMAGYYNAYSGAMDARWQQRVAQDYARLWPEGAAVEASFADASDEQRAVAVAAGYLCFPQTIEAHIAALKASLSSSDPGYDLRRVDAAYLPLRRAWEAGKLKFGASPAAEGMGVQAMVNWGFVLFLLYFGVNQVNADRGNGMRSILAAAPRGRRALYRAQIAVFQLSAGLVWLLSNAVLALTLSCFGGWGKTDCLVQDFLYNSSPYVWNAWQTMTVVLLSSFVSGQVIAAAAFCLVRLGKTAAAGFGAGAAALVLPLVLSFGIKTPGVCLLLPCLMQNGWMWSSYWEYRVGGLYLKSWHIAVLELLVTAAAAGFWMKKQEEKYVSL